MSEFCLECDSYIGHTKEDELFEQFKGGFYRAVDLMCGYDGELMNRIAEAKTRAELIAIFS